MDQSLGAYTLHQLLCSDDLKECYLAEHKVLKTPYVVQVLKEKPSSVKDLTPVSSSTLVTIQEVFSEDSKIFSLQELMIHPKVQSLKEVVLASKEGIDEKNLLDILYQMAMALHDFYQSRGSQSFGLQLENAFIDESFKVLLIDHSSPMWRQFIDQNNQATNLEDASIVSFGQIAYFMMTKQWPEGYFPLPSEVNLQLDKKWDDLIKGCLHHKPSLRIHSFLDIALLLEKFKNDFYSLKPLIKPSQLSRPEFEPNPGLIFQQELIVAKYAPQEKTNLHVEPILSEMRVIPAGEYYRGSNSGARDEMPRHKIQLTAFALDVHPVTNEQFIRFLELMGGEKDAHNNDMIRLKESRIKRSAGKLMIESGYAKHPVVGVSWYGASAYAKWIGKRLPTEAEWEIAASSLKEGLYPTGDHIDKTMAHFFSSDTLPVMSFQPTSLGLFDMAGNVYEWCLDWYDYNYYEASIQEPLNPQGPTQGVYRVLRGGCWKSLKEDLRVAHRHRNNPGAINGAYGFRCAADVH